MAVVGGPLTDEWGRFEDGNGARRFHAEVLRPELPAHPAPVGVQRSQTLDRRGRSARRRSGGRRAFPPKLGCWEEGRHFPEKG